MYRITLSFKLSRNLDKHYGTGLVMTYTSKTILLKAKYTPKLYKNMGMHYKIFSTYSTKVSFPVVRKKTSNSSSKLFVKNY